jgi:hypothetical protein
MNGTAMGMRNSIRQVLASVSVLISELMFAGTIVPISQIIFALASISGLAYLIVCYSDRKMQIDMQLR